MESDFAIFFVVDFVGRRSYQKERLLTAGGNTRSFVHNGPAISFAVTTALYRKERLLKRGESSNFVQTAWGWGQRRSKFAKLLLNETSSETSHILVEKSRFSTKVHPLKRSMSC